MCVCVLQLLPTVRAYDVRGIGERVDTDEGDGVGDDHAYEAGAEVEREVDDRISGRVYGSRTGAGSTPMARVQENNFGLIGRLLDDGMLGIVVPMVNTEEDARAAVLATRYPPLGGRSNGPTYLAAMHGDNYFDNSNDQVFLAVQIESAEAVENAEKIMSVEGIDGCWIGPSDLALSMGLGFADIGTHKRHNEAIAHVLDTCDRLGKIPGYSCSGLEDGQRRLSEGFQFVTVGEDSEFVHAGAVSTLKALRTK